MTEQNDNGNGMPPEVKQAEIQLVVHLASGAITRWVRNKLPQRWLPSVGGPDTVQTELFVRTMMGGIRMILAISANPESVNPPKMLTLIHDGASPDTPPRILNMNESPLTNWAEPVAGYRILSVGQVVDKAFEYLRQPEHAQAAIAFVTINRKPPTGHDFLFAAVFMDATSAAEKKAACAFMPFNANVCPEPENWRACYGPGMVAMATAQN